MIKATMRLDQFISQTTGISRSHAKGSIKKSWVSVNGEITKNLSQKVTPDDLITFQEGEMVWPGFVYVALHKPCEFVCSHVFDGHPSVIDLLNMENAINEPSDLLMQMLASEELTKTLNFVGRLDVDTTGLVILTNDNRWAHAISHPAKNQNKNKIGKTYEVELERPLSDEDIGALEAGVQLHNEKNKTLACNIERLDDERVNMTLFEGKYHQVKRMFAACENHVTELHRKSIGDITLDDMEEAEFRELSFAEVNALSPLHSMTTDDTTK